MSCQYPFYLLLCAFADSPLRYDLKQMLMKSSISRVPEELRKHEAAQQKSQRGGVQKNIER